MPRAIFFDLDETLIRHSTPVMEQLQRVCHRHLVDLSGEHRTRFQEHLLSNVGLLWKNIERHSGRCEVEFISIFRSGLEGVGGDVGLAEAMVEAFLASVVESTDLVEDAVEVLDSLAAAGIATGIITNGFAFLQMRKVKAHGLAERVRIVMTSEEAGAHKPDAQIFRMAMLGLGVAAGDCWHVGDHRENDIAGALGAGLTAVLLDPERPLAAAAPADAPYRVISRLAELPGLIAALGAR